LKRGGYRIEGLVKQGGMESETCITVPSSTAINCQDLQMGGGDLGKINFKSESFDSKKKKKRRP